MSRLELSSAEVFGLHRTVKVDLWLKSVEGYWRPGLGGTMVQIRKNTAKIVTFPQAKESESESANE